jgi:hypothetical protein
VTRLQLIFVCQVTARPKCTAASTGACTVRRPARAAPRPVPLPVGACYHSGKMMCTQTGQAPPLKRRLHSSMPASQESCLKQQQQQQQQAGWGQPLTAHLAEVPVHPGAHFKPLLLPHRDGDGRLVVAPVPLVRQAQLQLGQCAHLGAAGAAGMMAVSGWSTSFSWGAATRLRCWMSVLVKATQQHPQPAERHRQAA